VFRAASWWFRALAALALLGTACAERRPAGPPNVVLIGVDTLRADHLGLYGYSRDTSPQLDRFARGAVVFETCITPMPRTTQAVSALLSGRHPVHTGVRTLVGDLPPEAETLATRLRDRGYATARITATGILHGRLEHGFQRSIGTQGEKGARETTDAAIAELERLPAPRFLFVFYRDPHMGYAPPELVFDAGYEGPHRERIEYPPRKGDLVLRNRLAPRVREHVVALYDSEIAYVDRELGRLLDWLDRNDPDALVVVTADHGEALGERGDYWYDHGAHLDQPALRVPLVIRGLGLPPQRVRGLVRLEDVMPTVLARIGVDAPPGLDGVDLRRLVAEPGPELEAYAETDLPLFDEEVHAGLLLDRTLRSRKRALLSGGWKLVYVPRAHGVEYELYDLAADPEERRNQIGERDSGELRRKLDAWVAADLARNRELQDAPISDAERARLRDLGYLDPEPDAALR
jgi:arylsulfatase A-like enzyme